MTISLPLKGQWHIMVRMPKIHLKPHSAEFADENTARKPHEQRCDVPGCNEVGAHRAPKDRALSDYYHFCLAHVQDYNKAWDFFSGMSQADIEDHIVRSTLWDRPTRRYDGYANLEEALHSKAWQTYHNTEKEPPKAPGGTSGIDRNSPEFQALAIFGLEPPINIAAIKARYKELAKKHHPDVNGGSQESEELLKNINMAYTILRLSFEKYEKLPEK